MKILHVIQSLDPRDGGPPEVAACLAAAQARLGHAVTLAAVPGPDDGKLTADLPGFERVRRVDVPPPRGPARGLFDAGLARALAPFVAGHDVAHLHNVWDALLPHAAAAARQASVPYVILPHGMLDVWSMAQHPWRKRVALATTHRRMLRDAAAFHCLHDGGVGNIARLRLPGRPFLIPNGVWLERVDAPRPPDAFRSRWPALRDDPYVLFLGRLHHKKGLDFLLDAFDRVAARHPRVRLVIAGPDGGELPFVRRRAKAGAAPDRVHVVGPIYGDVKFAALAEAACFVLPSRQEGFPIAVLEALAAGAPAVVSAECHVGDVATSGAGFVVPLEADAIADAISRIVGDAAPRATYGAAGRRLVEAKYTWPRIAEATQAMYATILGG